MKELKAYSLLICFILILGGLALGFCYVRATEGTVNITGIISSVCGNGILEVGEICDDGCDNGEYASRIQDRHCNLTCDGWAPYCGDGIIQREYGEECDDSNNVSGDGCNTICLSEPPSGGGGRGGGWRPPPAQTKVTIQGKAYPEAKITLLSDGKIITTTKAGSLANFKSEITDITPGVYTFSLWAIDKYDRRSITFSFTTNVAKNATTTVSGIFLPPTIELSKTKLQKGETLNIYGQTAPESKINILVESPEPIAKRTIASQEGDWEYPFDTNLLDDGFHTTRAKATSPEELVSSYSKVLGFYIGKGGPGEGICPNADLNGDGRVNLVDFSILLYWWGRANACADQNMNGIVDLPDFSIMMYYWTG